MRTPIVCGVLLLVGLLLSPRVSAATFYVATNGNDSNSGSLSQPFATIDRAVSVVSPGDTVMVRGGVYAQTVNLWAQGTANARVVFQSYPGETAILDGTMLPLDKTLVVISGDWVDWKGFELRNSTRTGITIWEACNVRLLQNSIHHCWNGGVFVGGNTFGFTTDNLLQGNTLYQNCQINAAHTSTGGWPAAVGSQWTERLTVVDNVVYENHGEGIAFTLADQGWAGANTVYDNFSVGIYLDNAQFTKVAANFIYNTGNTTFYRSGYPANGISMANETYSGSHPLSDNAIVNNIILGGKRCIYYGNYQSGGGLKNTLIAHNTALNGVLAVLGIDSDTGHIGSIVANNIFRQTLSGASLLSVVNNGITFHHNAWSGGSPGVAAGTGDVLTNPLLANPGGLLDTDYRLQSGSPCIQAAVDLAAVTDDYWGTIRSSPRDIGAHEWSVSAPTVPTAPGNLTATALAKRKIRLNWIDIANNESGFRIERSTGSGAWTQVATVGANVLTWTDSNLTAKVVYSYRVRAYNSSGNSAYSNVASVTARN